MSVLAISWFTLAALLLAVYTIADGFDLGAGMLYGATRGEERRARVLGAMSPVYNGNEIWLLAGIGSLLAAFPPLYKAFLSAMYAPVALVLAAIVIRAAGVEMRSKTNAAALARLLDAMIVFGSAAPAWTIGLVAGNVLMGFPLDAQGAVRGGPLFLLRPYALLVSLIVVVALALHGALYLAMKTEGNQRSDLMARSTRLLAAYAALGLAACVASPFFLGGRFSASGALWAFWGFTAVSVSGYVGLFAALRRDRASGAFIASCFGIAGLVGANAGLLYPVLLPSSLDAAWGLTVANSALSDSNLKTMLVVALVALPLVAVYAIVTYRSFWAKAQRTGKA